MNWSTKRCRVPSLVAAISLIAVFELSGEKAQAASIDFESPTYVLSDVSSPASVVNGLGGQDGWDVNGNSDENAVIATDNSGIYVGGQAAGHVDSGGAERLGRLGQTPVVGNSMQADFFAGDSAFDLFDDDGLADSNLHLGGWVDVDLDGQFDGSSETGVLYGLDSDSDGKFVILFDATDPAGNNAPELLSSVAVMPDTWYRLNLSWVDSVAGGRDVILTAFDLTNNNDLGAVVSGTLTDVEFGFDPATFDGVGSRMTRGLVDNIQVTNVIPEPSTLLLTFLASTTSFLFDRRTSR